MVNDETIITEFKKENKAPSQIDAEYHLQPGYSHDVIVESWKNDKSKYEELNLWN